MAYTYITPSAFTNTWVDTRDTPSYDYAIKGELVYSEWQESAWQLNGDALVDHETEIKRILMRGLVENMMRKKCIAFTKQEDVVSNMVMFRARAFILPDADVQLLRVQGIIE